MTHPFDLKTPCLQAVKHSTALLVDTINVLPQQLLVCLRPSVLEIMVSMLQQIRHSRDLCRCPVLTAR